MILHLPEVLTRDQVETLRRDLDAAGWVDGQATAGPQAVHAKRNLQVPPDHPAFQELSGRIRAALQKHPLFQAAAFPKAILPPMFNRYEDGGTYGNHIDKALQVHRFTGECVRTDLSTTVFLSDPDSYEGGEMVIEDTYGVHEVKLPAGDAILYPSTSLHRVEPVTRGARVASFLWTQSLVRDAAQRAMLFELDMTIVRLRAQVGDTPEVIALVGHYHKLLQRWVA